jgi:hypothetical protein
MAVRALPPAPRRVTRQQLARAWRSSTTTARAAAARLRRPALTAAGLGCMSAAAYQLAAGWGLLATGAAVLVFEWLSGGDAT